MFLLVFGVLEYYLLPKVTGPLHLDMIWKTNNKQSEVHRCLKAKTSRKRYLHSGKDII